MPYTIKQMREYDVAGSQNFYKGKKGHINMKWRKAKKDHVDKDWI